MLVTNGILTHQFEEKVHEGRRLGRHLVLDARSLAYAIESLLPARPAPLKPAVHSPGIPVLDQGSLGSCTGNAGTYLYAEQLGVRRPMASLAGDALSEVAADLDEKFAVELYHEATLNDPFPGSYPPDDTGSSALGVCKALKAASKIAGYRWATTLHGFATLLQSGGVIMGLPWYEAFFNPDPAGFIDGVGWASSPIAGGHELYVSSLLNWNPINPGASAIEFWNSWGPNWGLSGRGRMRLATYASLKGQIDVAQFVGSVP